MGALPDSLRRRESVWWGAALGARWRRCRRWHQWDDRLLPIDPPVAHAAWHRFAPDWLAATQGLVPGPQTPRHPSGERPRHDPRKEQEKRDRRKDGGKERGGERSNARKEFHCGEHAQGTQESPEVAQVAVGGCEVPHGVPHEDTEVPGREERQLPGVAAQRREPAQDRADVNHQDTGPDEVPEVQGEGLSFGATPFRRCRPGRWSIRRGGRPHDLRTRGGPRRSWYPGL